VAVKAFTPFINLTASAHALLVFALSMTVVLMPKILSVVDLLLDQRTPRGLWRHVARN
jgi:membrane glycosyltransferase